jgi:CubicO group peptidase (beta-lactamase class C family)
MKSLAIVRRVVIGAVLVVMPVAFARVAAGYAVPLPSPSQQKTIAAALQPFVDNHTVAGAVTLVADKEKVLSLEAVGYADIGGMQLLKTNALFWIASQSKPITAAALMMLVDEGKVRLDDPVEKYLPELGGLWIAAEKDKSHMLLKKPAHAITVREILSHTSGMPFQSPMEQPTLDALTLRVGILSYAVTPLAFEPGTKYSYSNAGINTAGRIIEVVSGMPYEDFLDKRLLVPLGMKDTSFWPNEEQVTRLAKAYRPNKDKTGLEPTTIGQLKYPLSDRGRQPMPAGGLFSTATDVARFCQMMLNGGELEGKRYLSEAAVKEMTKKQTPEGVKDNYGLGWSVGPGTFGHGGAYATNMTVNTKRELVAVFMVQHAGFPGEGAKSLGAFFKTAEELYGRAK